MDGIPSWWNIDVFPQLEEQAAKMTEEEIQEMYESVLEQCANTGQATWTFKDGTVLSVDFTRPNARLN